MGCAPPENQVVVPIPQPKKVEPTPPPPPKVEPPKEKTTREIFADISELIGLPEDKAERYTKGFHDVDIYNKTGLCMIHSADLHTICYSLDMGTVTIFAVYKVWKSGNTKESSPEMPALFEKKYELAVKAFETDTNKRFIEKN